MKRFLLGAVLALILSGCLVPSEPAKQAEEIASIAAEGSLLAHDAAEGDTTQAFTRVHAEALRESLARLEPKVEAAALARLLERADAALAELAEPPAAARAARLERRLDEVATRAGELAP